MWQHLPKFPKCFSLVGVLNMLIRTYRHVEIQPISLTWAAVRSCHVTSSDQSQQRVPWVQTCDEELFKSRLHCTQISQKYKKKSNTTFAVFTIKKKKQININQCIGACTTAIIWGKLTSFIILAVSKTCINAVTNFRSVVTAAQSLLHEPNSFFKKFNLHIYNRCLLAVFQRGKIYWTTLFQQENQMKLREPCPKKSSHFII